MKYGIKTTAKYRYPYVKGGYKVSGRISKKARMRLAWMDYIDKENSIRKTSRYLDKHFPFDRIQYIGSDNGSKFLGELEKELEKRKVKHVFSSPRSPKQNPFVERVIRTTIDDIYARKGTEVSMRKQQKVIDDYVKIYYKIRLHESSNLMTPLDRFKMLRNKSKSCA